MEKITVDKRLYRINGVVKNYDWGGSSFIPAVTGIEPKGLPLAEYWLGAHPSSPSMIGEDVNVSGLDEWIQRDPAKYLGTKLSKEGRLPFLLKLLDVKVMLSIQVHPNKEMAEKCFSEENEKGVPIDSPHRNYKDANHKPELMVAMSDEFWLLHGFRNEKSMHEILASIPELKFLAEVFKKGSYKALYKVVMEMLQSEVNERLHPLLERIIPLYEKGALEKSNPGFWAARAALTFGGNGNIDRGIFSIYLFNLVRLEKGEAIFQDAGVPHAYLEGWNVEIMASSDNVLRGGLTSKHIDVKELLKHVKCEATEVKVIKGELKDKERVYDTPAPDFALSCIGLKKGEEIKMKEKSATVYLLAEGRVRVRTGEEILLLEKGRNSAIAFPGAEITLAADSDAMIFRAGAKG